MRLCGLLAGVLVGSVLAHSPVPDQRVDDWCLGVAANRYEDGGRTENSAVTLVCGRCSGDEQACLGDEDCNAGVSCVEPGSKIETVWWDDRTDAAVNDLATLATTQDAGGLFFVLEQWVGLDPLLLPIYSIGIDFQAGGLDIWHDPGGSLTNPGHCSVSVDRACTVDADCHFCALSVEEPPSQRPRACGSACDPDIGDSCDTSQSCVDVGTLGPLPGVGIGASPPLQLDYLIVIDTSRWLIQLDDHIQLMKADGDSWSPVGRYALIVPPGPAIGSIPVIAIEFEIPWSGFGCTGCPEACDCPDFGPGQGFRFGGMVSRGIVNLDYAPDGAIEDVLSEAVAGTSTTTTDSCPGFGTATTLCELSDLSQDAFVLTGGLEPGGRVDTLVVTKTPGPSLQLSWSPSCSAADVDYEIYEGLIGDYTTQLPVPGMCTTLGATTATLPLPAGDAYYLVVPSDGSTEGSYGADGTGLERPASVASCRLQSLGNCGVGPVGRKR